MANDVLTSIAAGMVVLGVAWAVILGLFGRYLTVPVLAALGVASIGLLVLAVTSGDDDDGPPGPDDLAGDGDG